MADTPEYVSSNQYSTINVEPLYPDLTCAPGTVFKDTSGETTDNTLQNKPIYTTVVPSECEDEYRQRQNIFNPKEHLDAKKSSVGQPQNNKDAFPIDKKVIELESHMPKIESGMDSDSFLIATEKRITQLENLLSTMSRYIFRIGARVNINCVYYGGQNMYDKYKCIRCLDDDLVNDCAEVSIDQCLNCSRYEPVIGQVYDILQGSDQNLSLVLDTNQGSYSSMTDHIKLSRVEEMNTESDMADLKTLPADKPKLVSDNWQDGYVQDWSNVSVDSEYPDVKSYQYSDGPAFDASKLIQDTMAEIESQEGANSPSNGNYLGGSAEADLDIDYHGFFQFKDSKYSDLIGWVNQANDLSPGKANSVVYNMIKSNYYNDVLTTAKAVNLDPLLVLAIIAKESTGVLGPANSSGYGGLMGTPCEGTMTASNSIASGINEYMAKAKAISTTYPLFVTMAYAGGQGVVVGGTFNGHMNPFPGWPGIRDQKPKWIDIAPDIYNQLKAGGYGLKEQAPDFARICFAYRDIKNILINLKAGTFVSNGSSVPVSAEQATQIQEGFLQPVQAVTGATPYDGKYRIPFDASVLHGIYFTSNYGPRTSPTNGTQEFHDGIDLAPSGFNQAQKDTISVLAAAAGTVKLVVHGNTGYGNHVAILHDDGVTTFYGHMKDNTIKVSVGQHVEAGTPLGIVGTTGNSTGVHLHFGAHTGCVFTGTGIGGTSTDPKQFLSPKLAQRINKALT